MPELSDEQLVERYLGGDEDSLNLLIQRYLKPIYGFVFGYVKGSAEAEDISQETFVKMWRNLKKFNQKKNFKTWLYVIAQNTALDYLKKKKARPFAAFLDEEGGNKLEETLIDPEPLPSELLERKDVARVLSDAMDKLASDYRVVLSLYYNDHFNFREISEILGDSLNTVKSRHRRALHNLRVLLEANR